jgi:hypothetical protein
MAGVKVDNIYANPSCFAGKQSMVIALERAGNLFDRETGGDASGKASRLQQGTVGMTPRTCILGKFLFRVGIELLEGNDVGFQRFYILDYFLFTLWLFSKTIPNIVAQHPKVATVLFSFAKKMSGEKAKKEE